MDQNKSILTQGRNNQAQTGSIIFWKHDVKTFLKIYIILQEGCEEDQQSGRT